MRVPAVTWCKDKKVTWRKDMRLTAVTWYKDRVTAATRCKNRRLTVVCGVRKGGLL